MTANLPVSPILRRDLSPIGLDAPAEEGLKSPSPKPKFAPRASSPALPPAAVHPGGPLRTGSILKKPLETPGGGYNWFGGEGEGQQGGQAVRPLSPPLASHAGPGLGLGEAVHAASAQPGLSPPQSASLHPVGSPLPGAWSTSHAVASAAVSDSGQSTPAGGSVQGSRATSPHCHFAPLPKVDGDRPGTRRNSFAQGVRSKILALNGGELSDEPAALDTEDPLSHEFTKLSTGPPPPPTERGGDRYPRTRRSSSGRSTSPSPSRRPTSALSGTTSASGSSAPTSRSHSPAMSRHASGDALHLHFIQAAQPKTQRSVSQTRDGSSAGEALPVLELANRGKQERRDSGSAVGSPMMSPGRTGVVSPTFGQQQQQQQLPSSIQEVAPLHSAATAVAPVPAKRMTSFVEPSVHELQRDRSPSIANRCKPTNQDIVALDPLAGAEPSDDELEEVEEEDEEEDEDDEGSEGEDDERARESEEEEEDDDDEEDEEDSEAEKMRKTAISGGVEVVHWRKEDPDED